MKRGVLLAILGLGVAACEKREAPPAGGATDSTAVVDSAARDSSAAADSTSPKVGAAPADPKIIGHDSAFGPIGAINDSTGKVEPLPVRRP